MAQLREEIVSRAVACKLLNEQQIAKCKAGLPADASVEALVAALVKAQALTRWQVKQLQAGKTGTFFISHYKLLDPLGAGGMGQVFRAADLNVPRRQVAVKILPRQTATPAAVSRFRREGAAALQLQHDHIVRCFELGQHGDIPFLVMELVDGATLKDYIARQGQLSVEETARIGYEVSLALEHARQQQIVHRDIKPSNILLTRDSRVRLADLGLAKFFGAQGEAQSVATQTGMLLGTLDYLAPEQAEDAKRADTRSDIYSLGCTLYHCLTGQPPFATGTEVQKIMAHREQLPVPIAERNKSVENLFADIIEKRMLAKRPEDRYQTPAELAAALEPWLDSANRTFNVLDLLEEVVQKDAVSFVPLERTNDAQHGWDTHREYSRQGESGPLGTRPVNLRSRVERAGRAIGLSSVGQMAIAGAALAAVLLVVMGMWRFNGSAKSVGVPTADVRTIPRSDPQQPTSAAPRSGLPSKRALRPVEWRVLDPTEFASSGGATFKKLNDQSLLVSGTNPKQDVYTITADTDLKQITGLRLEVLTDDTLTHRGPGRSSNGNFLLTALAVAAAPQENREATQPVGITDCMASYSQANQQVRSLVDGRYGNGWSTDAHQDGLNIDRFAVFDFDRSLSFTSGATLTVTLRHEGIWDQHALGRFRLSVTGSENPVRNSGGTITLAEANLDMFRLIDLLYYGRVDEYRRDCAAVFARVDQTDHHWAVANNLAWAAALGPAGSPQVDLALTLVEATQAPSPEGPAIELEARDLDYSPDGRFLAVGCGNWTTTGMVRVYELAAKKLVQSLALPRGVSAIDFSADGRWLCASSWDRKVYVWDTARYAEVAALPSGVRAARAAFAPNSKSLAAASESGELKIWETSNWGETQTFPADKLRLQHLAFTSDSQRVLAVGGSFDSPRFGGAVLFDLKAGERQLLGNSLEEPLGGVAYSPDEKTVATGGYDKVVRVWDTNTNTQRLALSDPTGGGVVERVDYSPDGRAIAASCGDSMVRLWNAADGSLLAQVPQPGAVLSVKYSPDGSQLAAGGADKAVHILDARKHHELFTLRPLRESPKQPRNIALLNTYGGILYRAGRYDAAIQALNSSISSQPPKRPALPGSPLGTPSDWLLLAMSHHKLGNQAEARRWLRWGTDWLDWCAQTGAVKASGQPLPPPPNHGELTLRREAELLLTPGATVSPVIVAGDWKFSHRSNGQPVKDGQVAGADRVQSTLRDDSGGGATGQNHHYGGAGARYVQYRVPADGRPSGLDGWALDLGPGKGYLWFGGASEALRPLSDFSFWIRVQLKQARSSERQTIASWPGAWSLWVTPEGKLNANWRSVDDKLTQNFQGPDLASRSGQWVDLGFSFQGSAQDDVASDDAVRYYVDGARVGEFSGDARFTLHNILHVGMDEFGKWRCGDMLVDRMLCFHGVLDDDGFRRLSGPTISGKP